VLTVRVLGEQSLVGAATGTRHCSARALALVGYLAWHAGVPQQRSRIAGQFWPDSTSSQALTNLRRELHDLRAVLPGEALQATMSTLAWHDARRCRVDLRVFARERAAALSPGARPEDVRRRASAALAAYGGDFLPGLDEPWADEVREQLRAQCLGLLDRLVGVTRGTDPATAVEAARRAIALAPFEESRHLTLMQLQAAAGDRAAAVATYRSCRDVLARELGLRPAPALRDELRHLLADAVPSRRRER